MNSQFLKKFDVMTGSREYNLLCKLKTFREKQVTEKEITLISKNLWNADNGY